MEMLFSKGDIESLGHFDITLEHCTGAVNRNSLELSNQSAVCSPAAFTSLGKISSSLTHLLNQNVCFTRSWSSSSAH